MESHCGYTISEILLSFYHVHTHTAAMFCASPNVFVALYWYFLFPNCVVILDSNMTKLYRMPMPVSQLQYRTYRCAAFIGCVLFPSVSPFLLNIRLEVCKLSSGGNKSVFARAIMRLSIFLQINAPLPRCPPSTRGCARR